MKYIRSISLFCLSIGLLFSHVSATADAGSTKLRTSYYQCINATGGATWAIQNCIEKEFTYQDGRLNTVYKKLRATLPAAGSLRLRAAQRTWLTNKEKECAWDANTEGQSQRLEANECSLKKTAERADQLDQSLRKLR